ncbi:putative reverse transcriptase/RNA-dependent DNA polymerase [Citrus sinensis]|uniref:Reverse transcriptase/RNA-dependent DNA polymerase n=1 Tax=Citrus sinensis TaxID=2711 RepID=A0ACB8LAR1_CITSI|nr:putative reverse transcriptase/RNA-dependent DNA polymerase [Citrus sinensis]
MALEDLDTIPEDIAAGAVSRKGKSGGITMMWSSDINVNNRHYIDAEVQCGSGKKWRCIGVYRHQKTQQKKHTWTLLRRLAGYQFTWSNGRFGPHFVEERLDRFLCNEECGNHFQETEGTNLVSVGSDYYPIMMEVKEKGSGLQYVRKTFPRVHFEDMWSSYEACKAIIKAEWEKYGTTAGRDTKLNMLTQELQKAKQNKVQHKEANAIKKIEEQIHNILLDEEIYWRHRARADWLQAGDRNTKFFHSKATTRKRKNKIWGVEDKNGVWTEDGEAVERDRGNIRSLVPNVPHKDTWSGWLACSMFPKALAVYRQSWVPALTLLVHFVRRSFLEFTHAGREGENDPWPQVRQVSDGFTSIVLIKVVAQAVPAYAMSVFKIPSTLCKDIQKAMVKFWWGNKKEKHGIHWARWERMSHAKHRGGLGFRDISNFNQALLPKQSWRIIQDSESLMARVLKARYFKHEDFLNAKIGTKWRIGSGEDVQVYNSNWLPRPTTFRPISPRTLAADTKVADLIDPERERKMDLIRQHFVQEDADIIQRIPLPRSSARDELCWHYDKLITLKENFQNVPSSSNPKPSQWNAIWKLDLLEKLKIFMWRAAKNLLPTAENLWKRKVIPNPTCQRCNQGVETGFHAPVECKAARKIRQHSSLAAVEMPSSHWGSMLDVFLDTSRLLSKKEAELQIAYWWVTWYARNHFLFKRKKLDPLISTVKAEAVIEAFRRYKKPEHQQMESSKAKRAKQWKHPPKN